MKLGSLLTRSASVETLYIKHNREWILMLIDARCILHSIYDSVDIRGSVCMLSEGIHNIHTCGYAGARPHAVDKQLLAI